MYSASIIPPLRPGTRAITQSIFPYFLPNGLSSGVEVTILEVEEDGGSCLVMDQIGKQWRVAAVALDPGERVWESGRWVLSRAASPAVTHAHAA